MMRAMPLLGTGLGASTVLAAATPLLVPGPVLTQDGEPLSATFNPANNPGAQDSYCHQILADINNLLADRQIIEEEKFADVGTFIQYWMVKANRDGQATAIFEAQVDNIKHAVSDTFGLIHGGGAQFFAGCIAPLLGILVVMGGGALLHSALAKQASRRVYRAVGGLLGLGIGAYCLSGLWFAVIDPALRSDNKEVHPPISAEICNVEIAAATTE